MKPSRIDLAMEFIAQLDADDRNPWTQPITNKTRLQLLANGVAWQKCPSVSPGGKPYFWVYRFTCDGKNVKHTIVWNRLQNSWQFESEIL